jgi:hypothetical protein
VKKPKWWTGSWLFKSVLIWFIVFLVWLPVFSRWPDSAPARALTLLFVLCMLPLAFSRFAGVLGDLVTAVRSMGALAASSLGKLERRRGNRRQSLAYRGIAEGLEDIREGRVHGPYRSAAEALKAFQERANKPSPQPKRTASRPMNR